MNRSGLSSRLGFRLSSDCCSGSIPSSTLKLSGLFYDATTRSWPLKHNTLAAIARDGAMWIAWGLAAPAIVALVVKLVRPDRPPLISGRAIIFLLVTLTLSAGILTNLTFKSYWGRPPRPVVVTQFNGVCSSSCRGGSARRLRPELLVLLRRGRHRILDLRPRGVDAPGVAAARFAAATLLGVITSVLRMAFGGHFFTDVAAAGLVTFVVVWLAYGYIYRWPSTRLSDKRIDAALGRLCWPPYRFFQRWRDAMWGRIRRCSHFIKPAAIKRVPIGVKFVIRALEPQTTSAVSTDWKPL